MPAKRIIKARDLSGIFIYQDSKRGTIYYDIVTRKGYILTTSDVNTYTVYSTMLPLCLIASVLFCVVFHFNYIVAILIFVPLYLLTAFFFRVSFFYNLPVAENWKPFKKDNLFVYMAKTYSAQRLIVLTILLLALTILMPIYAKMEHFEGINYYASLIIPVFTFLFMVVVVVAFFLKKKYDY